MRYFCYLCLSIVVPNRLSYYISLRSPFRVVMHVHYDFRIQTMFDLSLATSCL
jgi:hypothetical protein